MSHLVRVRSSGSWFRGYKPSGQNLRDLDQNTFLAINGDDGGIWATTGAIVIGGAGVVVGGPWSVSGPVGTGGVYTNLTTGATITFGKGDKTDYFQIPGIHTFSNQTLITQASTGYSVNNTWIPKVETSLGVNRLGMQSKLKGSSVVVPLRVFDGFTCSRVTFRFAVTQTHGSVPDVMPSYRAFAVDSAGTILPMRAADSTTSPIGFVQMTAPGSGAIYTNSFFEQNVDYDCNQNNIIDCSKYSYFGEFIDESGNNSWSTSGTLLIAMASVFPSITRMDGRN